MQIAKFHVNRGESNQNQVFQNDREHHRLVYLMFLGSLIVCVVVPKKRGYSGIKIITNESVDHEQ
jgi:hypothetical protein